MPVEDICRAEDREAFRQFLRRESGSVNRGVFRHVKRGGEPIDIEGVGYLVSWRGRAARLVLINDITERLRTQHALEFSQERLRALSRRLLEVQEQERRRLARDLHDDVGQALTALKIQLESRSRVEECVETVSHTLERVRQLSLSLRPPQLDDLGLAWRCARISTARRRSPVSRRTLKRPRRRANPAAHRDGLLSHRAGSHQQRSAARPRAQFVAAPARQRRAARALGAR